MALYPSLEDMKFDQLMKSQLQVESSISNQASNNSIAPSAPRLSEIMDENPYIRYPFLGDYMGLELTNDVIAANMPEYLDSKNMQMTPKADCPITATGALNNLVAPLSGQSVGLQRAFVTNGIRQITLCKDGDGRVGIRVQSINNGVFINLIRKGSPAALAGVRFGDQVLEINGKSVAGLSMDAVHDIIKKSPANGIIFVIRDRPFERTVTLHKDSTGHVGFSFKDGKVVGLVIDSSAAKNGLLTEHNLLEVNGQNVVGLKDKDISKIISEGGDVITDVTKFTEKLNGSLIFNFPEKVNVITKTPDSGNWTLKSAGENGCGAGSNGTRRFMFQGRSPSQLIWSLPKQDVMCKKIWKMCQEVSPESPRSSKVKTGKQNRMQQPF